MNLQRSNKRKFYSVDSKSKSSGTNENFSIVLDVPFRNNFNTLTLLNCEIPKSYYMTDSALASTVPVVSVGSGSISFTDGRNYSAAELVTVLQSKLVALSLTGVFTVTFDTNTGKFTISNTLNVFTLDFTNAPVIAKYLGFTAALHTATLRTGTIYDLVSTNVINLQRYDSITLSCGVALNNNNNILGVIYPNSFGEGAVINYETQDSIGTSVGLSGQVTDNIAFSLSDSYTKEVINLNGVTWRCLISMSHESIN